MNLPVGCFTLLEKGVMYVEEGLYTILTLSAFGRHSKSA
jgi:hypothetical protein